MWGPGSWFAEVRLADTEGNQRRFSDKITIIGTVDFDAALIAFITFTSNLANSDFLANTGVNYLMHYLPISVPANGTFCRPA